MTPLGGPVEPDLLPAETALVSRATDERRLEFAAGRYCAHRALEQIGGPAVPILRGRLGSPTWPPRFAGSITHDGGVAAAVYRVTRPGPRLAIDLVDCSDRSRLADIAPAILSDLDKSELGYRIDRPPVIAEVFSAKEAAVKILSADLDRLIEFNEISPAPTVYGFRSRAGELHVSAHSHSH